MYISFDKVTDENEKVFRNLWQFFGYDFSEMNGMDLSETGIYVLPSDYQDFLNNGEYISYIIKVNGAFAGLAVIKFLECETINYFRHFFIMRKYRRTGIGKSAVHMIFDMYPGKWRVSQFDFNVSATMFWRRVIATYHSGEYVEVRRADDKGPQQEFSGKSKPGTKK